MKLESHMDRLMHKLEAMNELLNMPAPEFRDALAKTTKRTGKGGKDGIFGAVTNELFFRADRSRRPQVVGVIHPSDGHPQQEHCPDFNWFRPLTWNNPTWTLYWPELII